MTCGRPAAINNHPLVGVWRRPRDWEKEGEAHAPADAPVQYTGASKSSREEEGERRQGAIVRGDSVTLYTVMHYCMFKCAFLVVRHGADDVSLLFTSALA